MTWFVPVVPNPVLRKHQPDSVTPIVLGFQHCLLHSVSTRKAHTEDAAQTSPLYQYLVAVPPAYSMNLASDSLSIKSENNRNKLFGCCDEQVVWHEWNGQSMVPSIVSTFWVLVQCFFINF